MAVMVREKKRGSGEWYCYADHHGQRKAKAIGPGKAGKKLAEAVAKQWAAYLALGQDDKVFAPKAAAPVAVGTGPRLRDAVLEWIDQREKTGDLRGASPSAYRSAVRTWVLPHALPDGRVLGDLPVGQVSREHLGAVVAAIKSSGRSRSTVEHVRNALRGCFRNLVETKVLSINPAADLGYFVGRMKRSKRACIFDTAECATLLRAAEGTQMAAFVATALGTGARWGELAALTRDDVDLERARIHFTKSWSPKAGSIQPAKAESIRFVPLAAEVVEVLRGQLELRAAEGWGPDALVFPRTDGGRLRHVYQAWSALLKRAGIAHKKFHTTRHTFASHALKASIRPELVQRWLGHTTLTMTLNTYGHFIPDTVGDAEDAAKLGNILKH